MELFRADRANWELVALGTSATSTGATTRGTAAGGEAWVEEGVSGRKGRQDSWLPHLSTYQHVVHGALSSQPGKIAVDKRIILSRQTINHLAATRIEAAMADSVK
jgi:hypothetical protein